MRTSAPQRTTDTDLDRTHHLPRATGPRGITAARGQALLAAGLLAVTAAAPAALAAAEPDSERDGTTAAQDGVADPAVSANYDPGGNATPLPDTAPASAAAAPPQPGAADDGAPVDHSADSEVDDPVVDTGDGVTSTERDAAGQTPNAAANTATVDVAPTPAVAATDPGAAPAAVDRPAPAAAPTIPLAVPGVVVGKRHTLTVRQRPARRTTRRADAVSASIAASATSARTSVPVRRAATSVPVPPSDPGARARPGERTHIVLAGESLWAIATDLLGRDATDAQIAREVQRLWRLNRARIGTGDPDMLYTDTKLVLRYPSNNAAATR